ncbi:hypothetical protein FRB99_004087 [Tulasnella sp. 403]|nr:hypothetical protein FRB99_004087 [Tulasnella sp. 403]
MSLQHFGRGALRVAKNYTKGYSDVQAKVRDATSNDPWGPSGTQMNEIAQMTYNQQDFVEIMEMLDKRLNDKGKNWRHVFKALTVLDYCLHAGSENVVLYFRDNLYVIKTLKEFQYIDEDMKDQGANVRQKAKDITNLLMDEARLRDQRRSRAFMKDRMLSGEGGRGDDDNENENVRRRSQSVPAGSSANPRRKREDDDLQKALELSRQTLAEEQAKQGRMTAEERDLAEALRRSKEEDEARQKAIDESNSRSLFDDGTQHAPSGPSNGGFPLIDTSLMPQQTSLQPQFTANPYWQQQQLMEQQQHLAQQQQADWMLQQQQFQALQAQQQQQQQQEEWLRQQQMQQLLHQQQQQQQAQLMFQQQPQQQGSLFAQPTGYGSNNPFALAAGTAQLTSPGPSFSPSPSTFGALSPPAQQPQTQPQFTSSPSPQPPPSPTSANTLANARRPHVAEDPKHAQLNALFANREDGIDSFGNFGNLRYGHAFAGQLTGQPTGGTNPFAKTGQQTNEQPFFSI